MAVGCDGDGGTDDGGRRDAGSTGTDAGGGGVDCSSMADGTTCAMGRICLGGSCEASLCGDGFIDTGRGEECEDGNDVAFDGCEPTTCVFTCTGDSTCDDGAACNGVETCTDHVCVAGALPGDGAACTTDDAMAGVCRGTDCVSAGCGNGVVDTGEECDDMNMVSFDGCENDCTYSCEMDEDCDDLSVCTGTETCDTATHACVGGTALDCDDSDDCTVDSCDPVMGCDNVLMDMDGDGYAPTSAGACGTDCNDMDNMINPGAAEVCDMPAVDNDCNPATPEPASSFWFLDCDRDGFSVSGAIMQDSCAEPAPQGGCGWTTRIPSPGNLASLDCNDTRADMFPGNTTYYPEAPATSGGSHPSVPCTGLTCTSEDTNYGAHDCDNNYGDTSGGSAFPPSLDTDGQAEWVDRSNSTSPISASASGTCSINVYQDFFTHNYVASCTGDRGWTRTSAPTCGYTGTYTWCGNETAGGGIIILGTPTMTPDECIPSGPLSCIGYSLICVGSSTACSHETCTPGSRGCIRHYYRCPRRSESRTHRCR
ncbi:MAG: DUF4215 domain-containing protein [Sandaracinaceae bacterium]